MCFLLTILDMVATVLTVYGIETYFAYKDIMLFLLHCCNSTYRLRYWNLPSSYKTIFKLTLQQYLPFTVLKLGATSVIVNEGKEAVATVLTVYGIET